MAREQGNASQHLIAVVVVVVVCRLSNSVIYPITPYTVLVI